MAFVAERVRYYRCNSQEASKLSFVWFPSIVLSREHVSLYEALSCEEICSIEDVERRIGFDGSSIDWGGVARILLCAPVCTDISFSFRLKFHVSTTNWVWSSDIGLISSLQMGICRLCVKRDSMLIIKQVNGEFALKKITLLAHQNTFKKPIKSLLSIRFEHVLRVHNKHVDALTTLASKLDFLDEQLMWK